MYHRTAYLSKMLQIKTDIIEVHSFYNYIFKDTIKEDIHKYRAQCVYIIVLVYYQKKDAKLLQ